MDNKVEVSFFDVFYTTVNTFKEHLSSFVTVAVLEFLLAITSLYLGNYQDDVTKISGALLDLILGVIIFVIFANIFYAKQTKLEFSLQKALWDLPTYLYYELALGVLMLISIILLFFPFLYVVYAFFLVPTVAILFDYGEEGIFAKAKRLVFTNHKTYLCILVITIFSSLIGYGASTLVSYSASNSAIYIVVAIILVFISFLQNGLVITFLNEVTKSEREAYLVEFSERPF